MKHILFFLFVTSMAFIACSSAKNANSSMISQGITGYITETKGNQMPMKGEPLPVGKGILTTVLVYEPTNISQVSRDGTSPVYTAISTKLVASVETDSTGGFTVSLPVGSYSLFIKQGKQFYANLFDVNNNIALFTVEEGKLTRADLKISSKASY
ncbi:MAG: hypothetical protein ABI581_06190 [Sediminibacterium sp.]